MVERLRIPYYFQRTFPTVDQAHVTRNWYEIEAAINGLSLATNGDPFDALVDASFTASDPANRSYKGIGEALNDLAGKGFTTASLFVRAGLYTETANWNTPGVVQIFGARDIGFRTPNATSQWDWNSHIPNSQADLLITNFGQVIPTVTGVQAQPFNRVWADNVDWAWGGINRSFATSFFGKGCTFDMVLDGTIQMGTSMVEVTNCDFTLRTGGTLNFTPAGSFLVMTGCNVNATSGGTIHFNLPTYAVVDINAMPLRSHSSPLNGFFTIITGSGTYSIRNGNLNDNTVANVGINANSAFTSLFLEGHYSGFTQIQGAHTYLHVNAVINNNTMTIAGPSVLDLTMGQKNSRLTLTGELHTGHIKGDWTNEAAGGITFLTFTGASVCNLDVCAVGTGAAAGDKSFALDAASNNNILDFAGDTTFPVAGTNAGAANLIRVT